MVEIAEIISAVSKHTLVTVDWILEGQNNEAVL